MSKSRFAYALLTSIAALAFSATATRTLANDITPPDAQVAHVLDADLEVSAQGRRGGGFGGGGGRGGFGGGGRQGGGNVGRMGRQGGGVHVGRQGGGRIGTTRIGTTRIGTTRIGTTRIGTNRIGYYGRVGRYGYRYGRIGRIGYVPVPIPVPLGPGFVPGPGLAPRLVAPPCPVCPVQACLIAVYADPNLTGAVFETADNQPRLDLTGWQNQITSIIVKSGTWEFFPDIEFKGLPTLRLAPGSYGILEPQWTRRIGSYMCVR